MREALFIKKNKDRWLRNQHMPSSDPDEMAADFTQLVDDLAYAKTFYPTSKVTTYVNKQASSIYLNIYRNRKEETNRLLNFWKYDLPLTIRKHHRTVFFSFILFLIFFSIGFFVSLHDPEMASGVLGPEYVSKTMENIEAGNPFGIYESGNPILSWLHLMIHNIRVSFLMFVSGIFAGIPSLYMLSENAIMVGVFDQMFAARGFGIQFFLVVFIHGTLELTALIIAAAAGLILGKSYLFPGTVSRLEAFKQGAKDGVKIMIGLLPVFGLAAFFEGFITRLYNDLSMFTSLITGLSVLFVIWYFIIYPIRLGKKMAAVLNEEEV
ncbi:MAG: stage II sporulation protein M [Chitinophagaceae bacterium]